METFASGPLSKGTQLVKRKNNKPLIFSKNALIFPGSFTSSSCNDAVQKKFIKCSAHLSRHSNNYYKVVIINFTLNSLIILYTIFCDPLVCYLGILAAISNIQIKCSVDVVLPRPLASDKSRFYLKTNSTRSCIIRTSCCSQDYTLLYRY